MKSQVRRNKVQPRSTNRTVLEILLFLFSVVKVDVSVHNIQQGIFNSDTRACLSCFEIYAMRLKITIPDNQAHILMKPHHI